MGKTKNTADNKQDSKKQCVYVAEESLILSKLICAELNAQGYETQVFTDGFSALKRIVCDAPACIIADRNLSKIDGQQLCKILKDGSSKNTIPFILISTDENPFDFWNTATEANRTLSISSENFGSLIDAVNELLGSGYIEADSFFEGEQPGVADDEKMASWIVAAMDRSESFLQMTNNIINLYSYVKDTDSLVKRLFSIIYNACGYDAITIILDSQTAKVYKAGTENLDAEFSEEFWNICKTSYEQQAKKNHTITYEQKIVPGVVNGGAACGNLKSYYDFPIRTDKEFIGTLHLASSKKKLFTYKVQSSIEYILPPLANLLQQSIQYAAVTTMESKLRTAFLKFVPPQVIEDMLNSNVGQQQTNNNEKRNVVILMSDLRNFTSISEENTPEDVVNFLNAYFTHMVNIVKKYGGTVDKFIGDAVMVLFGAPISYTDNAKRAVMAAMDMYSQLSQIQCGQLKFPEGVKLDIGIGIHYGDVIVGNIGSEEKTNYTVIGDAVNLASRLEGLTKLYGAKVLVSHAVKAELDSSVNVMLLDSVKVKGKKERVQIYRVDAKPLPNEFVQIYEKGFKSYSEGAFSLAAPYFEKALEIMPDDKAAKILLGRCAEFAVNKPENWDGAIALTSK